MPVPHVLRIFHKSDQNVAFDPILTYSMLDVMDSVFKFRTHAAFEPQQQLQFSGRDKESQSMRPWS